ncbi:hypothetical protein Cni_G20001 [Canna indica]|uniref:ENTH domain-containing protein n=1 Tax=Canna indica TaxID=4628 RepID=A0AAQ3KN31_9LILI|nr:hypothetical protein Cni_G20001 [Canna indica]
MKVKKNKLFAVLSSLIDQVLAPRPLRPTSMAAAADRGILTDLEAAVARCTDKHDIPADEEHVHEILFLVSNAPGAITFLSRRLSARLDATHDPMVALKTLLLLHRLLRGGDRYFEKDLHGMWSCGELRMGLSWCASAEKSHLHSFVLRYSSFLKERLGWIINQAGSLEPIRQNKEEAAELTLYRLHKCQTFLDRVMDCLPKYSSISSQVMQSSFSIVLRESIRVYDSFCDGMAIATSCYSELRKPMKILALDIFNKACAQTPSLHEFYENCKSSIVGKNLDYPFVRIITEAEVSSIEQALTTTRDCPPSTSSEVQEDKLELDEASSILFSKRLETTISTVWVEFDEEEDSQTSSFSFRGLEDCLTGAS